MDNDAIGAFGNAWASELQRQSLRTFKKQSLMACSTSLTCFCPLHCWFLSWASMSLVGWSHRIVKLEARRIAAGRVSAVRDAKPTIIREVIKHVYAADLYPWARVQRIPCPDTNNTFHRSLYRSCLWLLLFAYSLVVSAFVCLQLGCFFLTIFKGFTRKL